MSRISRKTKDAADKTKVGWDAVSDSLTKYADDAMNWGQQVGGALADSFKKAEDAFVDFVKTGKLDFKSLADSMISDLLRIAVRSAILAHWRKRWAASSTPSAAASSAATFPADATPALRRERPR